ncbi:MULTISPECIES: ectoine/hydroxyectoine ABC transporter substrate-binding protein EhuB [unclassified Streptomyces]|uniref:ectoine/hydroxyectoine ABC transporter substrate-binding protein EhuB n=1 Tax=unclassified Streptomyces TaxID=2593676 RepID=UPI001660DCB0|nr:MULTISPECIES: ectoine/hydroxyectoine ABC transporter substrate-binding protein EhuB [unclassified Streptomyces]MBD0707020.1 ectoine/hydroxyectoine ABC transporter substrate-binding protein EhuB [Streptomyces sp. CBMA291]MBD0712959.1 ectoine/hydroxyectoine ABC transporter substrate-binding protein EhuB [Streptomyces sp. CBMA370]
MSHHDRRPGFLGRRGFLGGSATLGVLALAPALVTACSRTQPGTGAPKDDGELLAKLRKQGYVRVGFAGEAPYGFQDGGDLVGEAPTLHREVFTALGVRELRPTLTEFGTLIPGLQADRFDVVSAGMAITPERCAKVLFSEPEFVSPTALMVRAGNPKRLTDLVSCRERGATVGVLGAAVEASYAKAAGVPGKAVKTLAKPQDGLDALVAGRIDAFALTGISLRWLARTNRGASVEVSAPFVPVVDGVRQLSAGGAVFRQSAGGLRDAFDRELRKITGDPARYVRLVGRYGFTEREVPPRSLRTADLCAA